MATHIYGGDLRYTYISGNNYEISLTLYGDCSSENSGPLGGYSPRIYLKRGGTILETHFLREDSMQRANVSPVCAAYKDSTVCDDPFSSLPGARRFVYTKIVTMEPQADWSIVFDGKINLQGGPGSEAGRSRNITNIFNSGGQLVYLIATLDNSAAHNSSPEFTAPATPYFCNNVPQNYNLGAVDKNKDSLVSHLIPALLDDISSVRYQPGYSREIPVAVAAGSFSFDTSSGQMNFTPNMVQQSLVAMRVDEIKNGKVIGSSMREMTFVVLSSCNNNPPSGNIDTTTIVGGGVINNVTNVCWKEPILKLSIPTSDPDGHNINVKVNNIPPGATVNVVNDGTPTPVINVTWKTGEMEVGLYNLFVSFTDDACPLASTQTVTYPINIVNATKLSHEVLIPTGCIYKQLVQLNLKEGITPRIVTISNIENQVLKTFLDSTGVIVDSFRVGRYKVHSESISLKCKSDYEFTVEDSGYLPIPLIFSDRDVCKGDAVVPINIAPVQRGTLHWYDMEHNKLEKWPEYNTDSAAAYNWIVTQQFDTCETKPDTFSVIVHALPEIQIQNTNERLCTGDSVLLTATGGVKYNWQPDEWISQNDTVAYARVRQATNFVVTGYSKYNCANTDTILMDRLDQCCKFFYPDIFTPNNDGKNDKWGPVTEANADIYMLAIYNRWGERVYFSTNENERWDGTHNGRLCDVGTYSYLFRARCAMGRQETTEGVIILMR